ncbi:MULTISPECIES: VOC family protein [Cupriavidus]|uniref:Glyoxalase/bleomycin resistance protein/dioxygenase:3-demethylubiquinone-9 3-methyltransferase n=1 Tax=Cupriavidus pinatubonensis (strain JMP 134 / LMG 1197) TaxID=264198 RepID=Q46QJ1_CUPPJ|nr:MULTISPECIES: VOC family protein [Cupriavidus]QYY27776.1 VOC family protein [Cupriavidus pinatubonensis]TPQ40173.1 VOC family protein [Cupriavidus pinatubonensis]
MLVQPYLFFEGRCEEALEFYKKTIDAKPGMLMRFKDNPEKDKVGAGEGCGPTAAMDDKVMHAEFKVGDSLIMVSDGRCTGNPQFQGIALSITYDNVAALEKAFNGLTEGGQVMMPLSTTFFAEKFGMVTDRFGVLWMLIKPAQHQ